jgi:hypothetical protein
MRVCSHARVLDGLRKNGGVILQPMVKMPRTVSWDILSRPFRTAPWCQTRPGLTSWASLSRPFGTHAVVLTQTLKAPQDAVRWGRQTRLHPDSPYAGAGKGHVEFRRLIEFWPSAVISSTRNPDAL